MASCNWLPASGAKTDQNETIECVKSGAFKHANEALVLNVKFPLGCNIRFQQQVIDSSIRSPIDMHSLDLTQKRWPNKAKSFVGVLCNSSSGDIDRSDCVFRKGQTLFVNGSARFWKPLRSMDMFRANIL